MERPFRVLFVCIGNAIRSQMAEGFARCYGSDVLIPKSAGLNPATNIMPMTRKIMSERNIDLGDVLPKPVSDHQGDPFDLVVNLSGRTLPPELRAPVRDWKVKDPMGLKEQAYRDTADEIERLVMQLILELRMLRRKWQEQQS
ncbi:MAG: ArsC family transcriptional regulator [Acidobacteria bacterium]|nr:ArsC family transcriptional regulator [Acidobacteriota bacterium]